MAEKMLNRHSRRTARRRRELQEEPGESVGQRDKGRTDEAYMIQKVREFFHECGGDNRGSITKADMQTLEVKFGFSPQDLELVFDKLDVHGNGYLTREELTDQLSHFQTDQNQGGDEEVEQRMPATSYQAEGLQQQVQTEDEEKQHFDKLVERLGASVISEHHSEMWKLWVQIRREEPNLLGLLEDFMAKVTSQIQESQQEKEEVEKKLKRRVMDDKTDVQQLYVEMEQQIFSEKEKFQSEVQALRRDQDVTVAKNEKLKLTNQELEIQLQDTRNQLEARQQEAERVMDDKTDVQQLYVEMEQQIFSEKEKFQSEVQALRRDQDVTVAENEKLKLTNQELEIQLQDTRNQLEARQQEAERVTEHNDEVPRPVQELEQQISSENESFLSELQALHREQDVTLAENEKLKLTNQELETQLQETRNQLEARQQEAESLRTEAAAVRESQEPLSRAEAAIQTEVERSFGAGVSEGKEVGSLHEGEAEQSKEAEMKSSPERLYNIMFVGNSNVGKTSFINRFYDGTFRQGSPTTLGIDCVVRTMTVEKRCVALQLWDTAGQERFHSLTKQFLRKSDAVVVMYDITASQSFTEVRYWLHCVREAASEAVLIVLLGNKTDDAANRQVPHEAGERLAQECAVMFFECSACTDHNITAPLEQLTVLLEQQEQKVKKMAMEKPVAEIVTAPAQKNYCCA